jgi:hypothetical protein
MSIAKYLARFEKPLCLLLQGQAVQEEQQRGKIFSHLPAHFHYSRKLFCLRLSKAINLQITISELNPPKVSLL